jgi:hypothetical protein
LKTADERRWKKRQMEEENNGDDSTALHLRESAQSAANFSPSVSSVISVVNFRHSSFVIFPSRPKPPTPTHFFFVAPSEK